MPDSVERDVEVLKVQYDALKQQHRDIREKVEQERIQHHRDMNKIYERIEGLSSHVHSALGALKLLSWVVATLLSTTGVAVAIWAILTRL